MNPYEEHKSISPIRKQRKTSWILFNYVSFSWLFCILSCCRVI